MVEGIKNQLPLQRLTALWALSECGLGGFMHAFKLPFTGIIVGGLSILFIGLIANHTSTIASTLLKSLCIVLLVKFSVSPYSPITAYLAVSFQTIIGIVLFQLLSVNRFSFILLGIITFVESALQKLLTLTLLFGESFWEAIEIYSTWVNHRIPVFKTLLPSNWLVYLFLFIYFVSGVIVGIASIKVINLVHSIEEEDVPIRLQQTLKHKKSNKQRKQFLLWLVALLLLVAAFALVGKEKNVLEKATYLMIRSIVIITAWYLLISPFLLQILNKILAKKKNKYQSEVENTLALLPYLKSIVLHVWQMSKPMKGYKRAFYFLATTIAISIHFKGEKP